MNIWLFAANLLFIFLLIQAYKKLKKFSLKDRHLTGPHPIPTVSVYDLDRAFDSDEFGPTLKTEVHFIGRAGLSVIGAISDSEGWVLAVLAKKAKQIFEFGTCTGRTTYLLAKNSSFDAKVATLTLSPETKKNYQAGAKDDPEDTKNALQESSFRNFFYSHTDVTGKIQQFFGDSKEFDEKPSLNKCDLIFVDGSHAYSYVKSDSAKAIAMAKPGGLVIWHDYIGPYWVKGVYHALNELSKDFPLVHIHGTTLVAYRKPR